MYEKIKNLRKANELTQKQIADLLGVERSTYSYYENGKRKLDIEILAKLALIYNVPVESFINPLDTFKGILQDDTSFFNQNKKAEEEMEKYLSEIDDEEKEALLLFRLIKDKDEAISSLKQMIESEKKDGE